MSLKREDFVHDLFRDKINFCRACLEKYNTEYNTICILFIVQAVGLDCGIWSSVVVDVLFLPLSQCETEGRQSPNQIFQQLVRGTVSFSARFAAL